MRAAVLLLLIAAGVLAGSAYTAKRSYDLNAIGVEVTGRIVDVDVSHDDDGTTYTPTFEYTYEGETYRRKRGYGSSSRPTMGDEVLLIVHPDNPERYQVRSFMGQWFLPLILGAIGAALTFSALVVMGTRLAARRAARAALGPSAVSEARPLDDRTEYRADDDAPTISDVDYRGPFR